MISLGIETSGRAGSVALAVDGVLVGERDLAASGRRHARTLVPEVRELLASQGLAARDVNLVAVSIGPGSFTGLRVGVVCAKTLAYAVGCPIVGVDTFLAVAAAQSDLGRVWVIDDALRGDVFAGEYARVDGRWKCEQTPRLIPVSDWRALLAADAVVTGPGIATLAADLDGMILGAAEFRIPHARQVVALGDMLASEGRLDDPWTLSPFYMRRSAAEEKADQAGATAS
ncbi:tRNA (adenosine(37)-N6)-threonylcarbamoyltransferase complex dimerization subunit type 1 TsaB [Planctomicrobium piriforme]|uniref:tRNA threonylcarbamoyladenosine biosynthesis protein TsaB n=1 Tax=Planctomicrobium piriforme TaxID=1576369 RepID=A0A1I3K0J6_9PLAN|nr:tRNA (adenosine(37)-N6)-threonylcarbamoyltransferase complex dimerization subunit type 1 TsaB [Planctomicrobium piriforme]SFI65858.1 tRNA threonylcarbamoyladenosine biosynthesis protein TsaB [Planctomicrobium piriforme]